MHAFLDNPVTAQLLVEMSFDITAPSHGLVERTQRQDTHAEMLAYEIARYAPGLAKKLIEAGRRRLVLAPH